MAHLFKQLRLQNIAKVPVRHKRGPDHWLELKKGNNPANRALDHFDDFYANVYGDGWENIRTALLSERHKYMAIVNNFGDVEQTETFLQEQGALNLRTMYDAYTIHLAGKEQRRIEGNWKEPEEPTNSSKRITSVISKVQEETIGSIYPEDHKPTENLYAAEAEKKTSRSTAEAVEAAKLKSIEPALNVTEHDEGRIIKPNVDLSALQHYIPASEIKGLNDFVLESEYYKHYVKGADFSVDVVEDTNLHIPKYLNAYAYASDDHSRFPAPKMSSTDVLNYYLFDGASILPVLALDLKVGDVVLDMCAAPGGKSLAIMQTLTPSYLILNDITESRVARIHSVLNQFIRGFEDSNTKVILTHEDASKIEDKDVYDKILVDVPCTTDRHSLHCDDNNIFKPSRIKERLRIPDIQTEILVNALRLIKVGGTVVYSTCTLSPIQNEGVVQLALKRVFEEENSKLIVIDMTRILRPLYPFFKFGNYGIRYGHIAIPTVHNNWGPMYFCKIVRVE